MVRAGMFGERVVPIPRRRISRRIHAVALGAAVLALPGFAAAQSAAPQARPTAMPVVLGSTVTGAVGQHTAHAVRQGAELAIAPARAEIADTPRESSIPMRMPAVTADGDAHR